MGTAQSGPPAEATRSSIVLTGTPVTSLTAA